jgi:hypothetical protein
MLHITADTNDKSLVQLIDDVGAAQNSTKKLVLNKIEAKGGKMINFINRPLERRAFT